MSNGGGRGSIEIGDVAFHQCVSLSEFERDKYDLLQLIHLLPIKAFALILPCGLRLHKPNRSINFIPPDEEFVLMTYRLSTLHVYSSASDYQ
jgi:hypothetical protein